MQCLLTTSELVLPLAVDESDEFAAVTACGSGSSLQPSIFWASHSSETLISRVLETCINCFRLFFAPLFGFGSQGMLVECIWMNSHATVTRHTQQDIPPTPSVGWLWKALSCRPFEPMIELICKGIVASLCVGWCCTSNPWVTFGNILLLQFSFEWLVSQPCFKQQNLLETTSFPVHLWLHFADLGFIVAGGSCCDWCLQLQWHHCSVGSLPQVPWSLLPWHPSSCACWFAIHWEVSCIVSPWKHQIPLHCVKETMRNVQLHGVIQPHWQQGHDLVQSKVQCNAPPCANQATGCSAQGKKQLHFFAACAEQDPFVKKASIFLQFSTSPSQIFRRCKRKTIKKTNYEQFHTQAHW